MPLAPLLVHRPTHRAINLARRPANTACPTRQNTLSTHTGIQAEHTLFGTVYFDKLCNAIGTAAWQARSYGLVAFHSALCHPGHESLNATHGIV